MQCLSTGERARVMNQQMFAEERELGEHYGIFTLARGRTTASKASRTQGDESFEAFIEAVAPGKLRQAEDEVGDSKVRKGRWLAAEIGCPGEVADLYDRMTTALGRQGLTR